MRNTLFGMLVALAFTPFAGCGDDSATQDMAPDLSATRDMTAAVRDMTATGTGCLGIVMCAAACTTGTCVGACVAAGSTAGQTKYVALIACARAACAVGDGGMTADGGAGSCTSPTDASPACAQCIKAAAQSSSCSTQLNACLSG